MEDDAGILIRPAGVSEAEVLTDLESDLRVFFAAQAETARAREGP